MNSAFLTKLKMKLKIDRLEEKVDELECILSDEEAAHAETLCMLRISQATVGKLQQINESLAARVAAQSELLSKRAGRPPSSF